MAGAGEVARAARWPSWRSSPWRWRTSTGACRWWPAPCWCASSPAAARTWTTGCWWRAPTSAWAPPGTRASPPPPRCSWPRRATSWRSSSASSPSPPPSSPPSTSASPLAAVALASPCSPGRCTPPPSAPCASTRQLLETLGDFVPPAARARRARARGSTTRGLLNLLFGALGLFWFVSFLRHARRLARAQPQPGQLPLPRAGGAAARHAGAAAQGHRGGRHRAARHRPAVPAVRGHLRHLQGHGPHGPDWGPLRLPLHARAPSPPSSTSTAAW